MRIFLVFLFAALFLTVAELPEEVKASVPERQISYIRDDETEKFLKNIAQNIFIAAGLDPDSIKIIIVNDTALNAYVAGGQNLFIHTGLVLQAQDVAGLIGVIAHETGHIKGAHIIQKQGNVKEATIGTVAGYVLGLGSVLAGAPPEAGMAIGSASQNIAARKYLAYSRDYENAADTVALGILKKIGISPMGMDRILKQLMEKEKISGDISDPYLLTHPVSQERLDHVESFIQQNPGIDKPTPAELEEKFKRVKAKIMGFLDDTARTKLYYQNKNGIDAVYARAIAFHKEAKFDESIKLVNELIAEKPADPYFAELKAQFLFEQGHIAESIEQYRKALNMLDNSPLVRLKLAEALLSSNDKKNWQEAIGQLKAVLAQEPKNTIAMEKLGVAYGKLGKLGSSYLYLAEGAVIAENITNAKKYIILAERSIEKQTPDEERLKDIKKDVERLLAKKVNS